jgi:hypothetical protein
MISSGCVKQKHRKRLTHSHRNHSQTKTIFDIRSQHYRNNGIMS